MSVSRYYPFYITIIILDRDDIIVCSDHLKALKLHKIYESYTIPDGGRIEIHCIGPSNFNDDSDDDDEDDKDDDINEDNNNNDAESTC